MSMEAKVQGLTARQRAVYEASKVIEGLRPQDQVNVLLVEQTPTSCFPEFSKNHAEVLRFLRQLGPGLTHGDLAQANALASRLLAGHRTATEVYFFSDFQRKTWANAALQSIPSGARLFFVDTSGGLRQNRGILEARLAQGSILAGDSLSLEVSIGNFASEPFQDRVMATVDRRWSVEQDVSIAPWSVAKFVLPIPAGNRGLHVCQLKLNPDDLEWDNQYQLSYSVQEKEEVILVTDAPVTPRSGSHFLRTALNPYEKQAGSLAPVILPSGELSDAKLAGSKKIVLTGVDALSDASAAALLNSVFQGAGVLYFLDGPRESENVARLSKLAGAGVIPLQLFERRQATNLWNGTQQVTRGDFRSRYLKLFRGVGRQDLGLLEFYDVYRASALVPGSVLLQFGDDSPAMAVANHGLGSILFLNFSAGELSSNLARQRMFPAWIQDLMKALSHDEGAPTSYTLGDVIQFDTWMEDYRKWDLKSPGGQSMPLKKLSEGERFGVSFSAEQLGLYSMGSPEPRYLFAVNPSGEESDLRPMDKTLLPSEFAEGREAHFLEGASDLEEAAQGRPLFHWFLLGGVGILIVESLFQLSVKKATS